MPTSTSTLILLLGQIEPIMPLAQTLQTYGAWGICAILMFALAIMWRTYISSRDNRDAENKEQNRAAFAMVQEVAKTAVELKNATLLQADALHEMARRLENVEKKVG